MSATPSEAHNHRFHLSTALRLAVENKGSKGGKRGTGGIAKQNATLMRDGGYVFTEEKKEEEGGGSMKEKNLAEVTTTAEEEDLQGKWKVYLPNPCPAQVITYHDASHPSSRKKRKNSSSLVAPSAVGEESTSPSRSDQTDSNRETTSTEEKGGTEKEQKDTTQQQRTAMMRFSVTEVCVVNSDSLTAGLAVGDAAVLSFGNADEPGGYYLGGARAQEEDLCRLLPQLYPSLELAAGGATGGGSDGAKSGGGGGAYPIPPGTALLSRNMLAVRQPGTYALQPQPLGAVSIITAAMPICHSGMLGSSSSSGEGGAAGSKWWTDTVTLRIRSVLHAACVSGHAHLVLGAFGCGMFGNPPEAVARIFKMELASSEFRGRFSKVVFAIIDPLGTGNLRPFQEELNEWGVADDEGNQ